MKSFCSQMNYTNVRIVSDRHTHHFADLSSIKLKGNETLRKEKGIQTMDLPWFSLDPAPIEMI